MNEEQIIKWRLRCWLVMGLGVGFTLGVALTKFLDGREFEGWLADSEKLQREIRAWDGQHPMVWTNGAGRALHIP